MDFGGNATSTGSYLETVRSLHQTVVALRTALEESKKEILDLKTKAWPIDSIEESLTALAIENHALRRKLLGNITGNSILDPPDNPKTEESKIENEIEPDSLVSFREQEHSVNQLDEDKALLQVEDNTLNISNIEDTDNQSNILHPTSDSGEALHAIPNIIVDNESQIKISPNIIKVDEDKIISQDRSVKTQGNDIKNTGESSTKLKTKNIHFVDEHPITVTDSKKAKKRKKEKHISSTVGLKSVRKHRVRASIHIKAKTFDGKKSTRSLDSLTVIKTPLKQITVTKTTKFYNLRSKVRCKISRKNLGMTDNKKSSTEDKVETEQDRQSGTKLVEENQNEIEQEPEVDDIELIFTTEDTKESDFKEQLVSIDSIDEQNEVSTMKLLVPDLDQSIDISDRELDDDVFDGSFDQENPEENAFQVFLKRDNSQLYNSKSDNSINQEEKSLRSYYSYQDSSFENKSMEKDESFDRFEERIRIVETDISKVGIQEVEYAGIRRNTCPNPLQYRPLLHREAMTKGFNARKSRPILAHSNAIRKESGAQTDISALPGSTWRSESSLANKAHLGENFTTLPSKFPLPGSRLKLSEKTTVEARRVLLSDIGFTSMVPELSRSADHLCPVLKPPSTTYGQFLRTTDLYSPAYTSQRFTWTTTTATPSEGSHSHSRYSIQPLTPPVQTRRCSAPVSPSRRGTLKSTPSRVRFANGSLPELRGDWTQITADSGDSTDSLVEEAENYLRRSIDCILDSGRGGNTGDPKRNTFRRASAPDTASDNIPPPGWQPFLPRQPRDLKPDHWVKVITPEGKVRGGRIRYIGPVAAKTEEFVGVQLAVPEGPSDGTYGIKRYFQCEPFHGIFVPFKKVIMGWRP